MASSSFASISAAKGVLKTLSRPSQHVNLTAAVCPSHHRAFTCSATQCAPSSSSSSSASPSSPRPLPPTPPQEYSTHIPLYAWQKSLLTFGSSLASLLNPARGDMIALLSEVSGERYLPRLRDEMLKGDEGRRLLWERPSLNTKTVDMAALQRMERGTTGRAYADWLEWCRVGPDTRAKVQYISDPECAYVMQRYRECHDFFHLVCSMPVSSLGETVVKIFEAAHFGLPVAYLSSIAGPLRLSSEERKLLVTQLGPWAVRMGKATKLQAERRGRGSLLGVYWEKRWGEDWEHFRKVELGMYEDPPVKVEYRVRRGEGTTKKKAWTTTTVQRAREREAAQREE